MKIAVLGGGMVGSLIATQLSKKYELVVYDNTQLKLKNIKTIVNDVTDKNFPNKLKNYNLVINCLPGFMGYSMLETIIELDLPCIDISFMPENCLDLSNGRTPMESTIIPDAGVAPGLSNLIVGNLSTKNNIEEIQIMVGGLPKEKNPPWNYRAPFSPIDVIEEYTRPARAKIDNKIITKKALSDIINFEFEGIGELEAFLTDGLRTILDSDPKISKIPNLLEYTIRYPGHAKLVQELIEQDAFSDEIIEFQGKMITKKESTCMDLFKQWKLTDEDEFTLMIIIARNTDGKEKSYTIYDERKEGWSSMSRTTGLTACAFAELLISGNIKKKGIVCPEIIGKSNKHYNFVINYLTERGIIIKSY
tara:strand:+ start:399 stop:1487 length:1089 start_codon:yes stop_codon:yes gene_type:complete